MRPRGGYIGFNRVPAAAAANSAASGVWTLREAEALRRAGTWPTNPTGISIQYLVIAGGGAGAVGSRGGAGGAGGYKSNVPNESSGGGAAVESLLELSTGTSYTVTVGGGGGHNNQNYDDANSISDMRGTNGSNSSFVGGSVNIVSTGGGRGGANDFHPDGSTGGSGGSPWYTGSAGSGTINEGYGAGTSATSGNYRAGGGGGAGGAGASGTTTGNGGAGVSSSITGSAVERAGGGSGANYNSSTSGSATGGGGKGNNSSPARQSGTAGTANTGGGGGSGGLGGSGVVIIRAPQAAASTTGSPTVSTVGTDTVYVFTGSGSITF